MLQDFLDVVLFKMNIYSKKAVEDLIDKFQREKIVLIGCISVLKNLAVTDIEIEETNKIDNN